MAQIQRNVLFLKELDLPCMQLKRACRMTGKKTGLILRMGEKNCTNTNLAFTQNLSASSINGHIVEKSLNMIIKVVARCNCHLILDLIIASFSLLSETGCCKHRICLRTGYLGEQLNIIRSYKKLHNELQNMFILPLIRFTKLRISDGQGI